MQTGRLTETRLSSDSRSVMLYDFQTRKWSKWYSASDGMVSYPSWSSDSRSLYYFHNLASGHATMRRVRLGKSDGEIIADLSGQSRYGEKWGAWSGVTSD